MPAPSSARSKQFVHGATVLIVAAFSVATAMTALRAPSPSEKPKKGLGRGRNPIVQTSFTADPAPFVHDGVVYLLTGHDEDDAESFSMRNWLLYSSTDMVNWTDHGPVASLKNFSWAESGEGFGNGAWAPHVVERGGKFYMYCPVQGRGIGVLVADNPLGPYKDPIGKPLIGNQYDSIDPAVLIDKGQAYLYWGNPNLWSVKLNRDMVSFEGSPTKVPSMAKGPRPDAFNYQEAPWAYARKGRYYMAYASTCCPEGIGYAMSDGPTGPWTPHGYVMPPDLRSDGNHPGIIDYKGKTYLFGFNFNLNRAISDRKRERRSVCLSELKFNPDGSIQQLPWWDEGQGAQQLQPIDPYRRHEAETMSWSSGSKDDTKWAPGVKTESCVEGGMDLRRLRNGSYTKVSGVDFGRGAKRMSARVASGGRGGRIEVRLDGPAGPKVGECTVGGTGGWQTWSTVECDVRNAKGLHDLCFVYVGEPNEELFSFDGWCFQR